MPEFILNTPRSAHPFYKLCPFAKGYVEAMFFTNGDTGEDREDLLNELGVERLTRASCKAIAKQCDAFIAHIMPDGCFVRQWLDRVEDYDDEQAGRDFWFSRQGHGVGFFDREVLGDAAEALQDAARAAGESYVEVYRGWIHVG